jgi:predicted dehydrogenase
LFDASSKRWVEEKRQTRTSTYEQFVEHVRGSSHEGPDLSDGLAVQWVIEACTVSGGDGRGVTVSQWEDA